MHPVIMRHFAAEHIREMHAKAEPCPARSAHSASVTAAGSAGR